VVVEDVVVVDDGGAGVQPTSNSSTSRAHNHAGISGRYRHKRPVFGVGGRVVVVDDVVRVVIVVVPVPRMLEVASAAAGSCGRQVSVEAAVVTVKAGARNTTVVYVPGPRPGAKISYWAVVVGRASAVAGCGPVYRTVTDVAN